MMRRAAIVAFAVVASVLVVAAAPAAAQNVSGSLSVASKNTTNSDFNSASELTNVTVQNGNVALATGTSTVATDDFESGGITGYSGETGPFGTQTSTVYSGTTGITKSASDTIHDGIYNDTKQVDANANKTASVWYYYGGNNHRGGVYLATSAGEGYVAYLDPGKDLNLHRVTGPTAIDTKMAELGSSPGLSSGNWYQIHLREDGDTITAWIEDDTGSKVTSDVTATDTNYDTTRMGVWGYDTGISLDLLELTSSGVAAERGRYVSQTHHAEDVQEGFTNVTLDNATADVVWTTDTDDDGSFETDVASTTLTTSGNHTLALDQQHDDWRVDVTFNNESGATTAELHDEGVLFDARDPGGSNADPTGKIDTYDGDISLDVNDSDFALPQGDSVTVTATDDSDGSQIGQTTISSNQTVTFSYSSTAGANNITWTLADSYGNTATVDQDFSTPGQIKLRNETNPSELVDSPVTVTVRLFGTNETYERKSSNGTVDMSGIPSGPYIIQASPDQNYTSRTVYIKSIFKQQNIYLLHDSVASVESRFVLNDPTGEFGPRTILYIRKPINRSGNVSHRTVYADRFGVEGVTATLEEGQRYRIRIEAPDGTVQDIGPYRANVAEEVSVSPGAPTIQLDEYTEGWAADATLDNTTLEFLYDDPDSETDSLKIYVHEKGNESNQLGTNRSFVNLGQASGTYTLTQDQSNRTWVVNFIVERNGEEFTAERIVANTPDILPDFAREWRMIAGVGALLIAAGIFSILNVGVGAVATSLTGGVLWWVGFLDGATTAAGVVMALFVSVLFHLYVRSSP